MADKEIKAGDLLALNSVRLGDYRGRLLSTVENTNFKTTPEIKEASALNSISIRKYNLKEFML